jgi:hypothetical protein
VAGGDSGFGVGVGVDVGIGGRDVTVGMGTGRTARGGADGLVVASTAMGDGVGRLEIGSAVEHAEATSMPVIAANLLIGVKVGEFAAGGVSTQV